jgi:DNA-binding MarR family transcriptional regulator
MSFRMEALRSEVRQFIRLFGLLEQNRTPCGYELSVSQAQALQELWEERNKRPDEARLDEQAGGGRRNGAGLGEPLHDESQNEQEPAGPERNGMLAELGKAEEGKLHNPEDRGEVGRTNEAGLSQSELALRLRLERSTVSRLVDSLVKEGFVARAVNEHNRREVRLALTARGERTAEAIREKSEAFYEQVLAGVSEADRQRIFEGFRLFGFALQRHVLEGRDTDGE